MALQFLEELCHNHRILSAGYADADFIPLRNELEIIDSLGKRGKDRFFEFFSSNHLQLMVFPCIIMNVGLKKTCVEAKGY